MEYGQLGRTGLRVSRICLGTMNFGPRVNEQDTTRLLDIALDHGINFIDTANVYGTAPGDGQTESILGRWFSSDRGRRDRTVLATKVFGQMGPEINHGGLSAVNIRRSLDASLRRLQTDYVDLLQFHHVDRATPWDEVWQAVDVAIAQGKIVYSGSSNFAGWHIASAQEAARNRGTLGLVSEQSAYNLLRRDIETELLPAARSNQVSVLAWSPLQGGLLGGVLGSRPRNGTRSAQRASQQLDEHRDEIAAFEHLAAELGLAPAVLALAWLLHRPGVLGPVVGPRTPAQLDDAISAAEVTLDDQTLSRLDEIFPKNQEAPESYSW